MKLSELIRGLNKYQVLIGYGNKRDWVDVELPVDGVGQITNDIKTGNCAYLGAAISAIYSSSGVLRAERFEYNDTDDKGIITLHFWGNLDGQEIKGRIRLRMGSLLEAKPLSYEALSDLFGEYVDEISTLEDDKFNEATRKFLMKHGQPATQADVDKFLNRYGKENDWE